MSATSPAPHTNDDSTIERLIDITLLGGVATAAAVFSWHNVLKLAEDNGQQGWLAWVIAACVETMAIRGMLDFRRRRRLTQGTGFAIALITASAGLQLAAQIAEVDARHGPWGYVLAAVPAATFLILVKLTVSRSGQPSGPLAEAIARAEAAERAKSEALAEAQSAVAMARQEAAAARRASEDEARRRSAVEAALAAERSRGRAPEKPTEKTGPKAAPSREHARAILMGLEDFEAVTNAELARLHGGTDTFWRGRKNDLRGELVALTAEAGAL